MPFYTRQIRRVLVVGSRGYPDLAAVRQFVWELERDAVVISGGARGVDTVAVDEARRLGMAYEVYPARWSEHGRSAGMRRNHEMVERATEVVAFWDGRSRGTAGTIEMARSAGKPLTVVSASGAQSTPVSAPGTEAPGGSTGHP